MLAVSLKELNKTVGPYGHPQSPKCVGRFVSRATFQCVAVTRISHFATHIYGVKVVITKCGGFYSQRALKQKSRTHRLVKSVQPLMQKFAPLLRCLKKEITALFVFGTDIRRLNMNIKAVILLVKKKRK